MASFVLSQQVGHFSRTSRARSGPARVLSIAAPLFAAQPQHTGDNAGMIAFAAWAERETGGVNAAGLALEIAPSLTLSC